jgi:hypothetical protein
MISLIGLEKRRMREKSPKHPVGRTFGFIDEMNESLK